MYDDDDVPPLDECEPEDFDYSRVGQFVRDALGRQPVEFMRLVMSGRLTGTSMTPFNRETGLTSIRVGGVPLVSVHYSRFLRRIPLDLEAEPPTQLPAERVVVDLPPDDAA